MNGHTETPSNCVVPPSATFQDCISSPDDKPLLSGIFTLSGHSNQEYHISLTTEKITISRADDLKYTKNITLKISDVVGCETSKSQSKSLASLLSIYAYPHTKKFGSKKTVRQRQMVTVVFCKEKSYEENHQIAALWKNVIFSLANALQFSSYKPDELGALRPTSGKRFLVLVNPFSGPGKALEIFQDKVVPMLMEANCHFNLIVTEYAGHAKQLVQTLTLKEWDCIVIISGDGLVFEVINGLMSRQDWPEAIKTPIGVIPGGSGNALACALLYAAGEPYLENSIMHSSYLLVKHNVLPMDLVAVDTCDGRRLYSFLSIAWGIIADVDIESEKYRSLGNARFTVGAIVRIIGLRKYRGRLSFLPVDEYKPKNCRNVSNSKARKKNNRSMPGDAHMQPTTPCTSNLGSGEITKGVEAFEDESGDVLGSEEKSENVKGSDRKSEDIHPKDKSKSVGTNDDFPERRTLETENGASKINQNKANCSSSPNNDGQCTNAPSTTFLSKLDQPVPSNWTTIEDEFIYMIALVKSHISSDFLAIPKCRLNDGVIYLSFMRAGISRAKILSQFNDMEKGRVESDEDLEIVKVRAFRLEPLTSKGTIMVDGEVVNYGPVQAQLLPSMARVMGPANLL